MNKPQWSKTNPDRPGIWAASFNGRKINTILHLIEVSAISSWTHDFHAFICDTPEITPPEPELKPCKICGGKPACIGLNQFSRFHYYCQGAGHILTANSEATQEHAARSWNDINA